MNIRVAHAFPPIPTRGFDYCAYIEGREENAELYGWGPTKEEALAELGGKILGHVIDHVHAELGPEPDALEAFLVDIDGLEYLPF